MLPEDLQDKAFEYTPTSRRSDIRDAPSYQILERGQRFFDRIYGTVSKRVMRQMDCCGTEDLGFIALLIYGHILSNETVLTSAETSCVLMQD